MPVRANILTNATIRDQYVEGAVRLKAQFTGVTTSLLGIGGPSRPVSTWDRFVAWHHAAMGFAHGGPLFLPWHRVMLRTIEQLLQQVLEDDTFGLPYWDWAADGELTAAQQLNSPMWDDNCMGRAANAPGRFTRTAFPVRLAVNSSNQLGQTNRALQRARGVGFDSLKPVLPVKASTDAAVNASPALVYDGDPWDRSSEGFRCCVEGWNPPNDLHNLVHIWVGGDMLPSASPNDPVFFLNHCNVDRVWEAWMQKNGRVYKPTADDVDGPDGQRLDDPIQSPFGDPVTPADVLDMTDVYTYDNLEV
jgi:tyrosinase